MKPICVKCERFYRPKKNGVRFIEGMPHGTPRPLSGRAQPEAWKPYKVWMGDLWHCPDCGHELIVGTGMNPLVEQYMPDFLSTIEQTGAAWLLVKDC